MSAGTSGVNIEFALRPQKWIRRSLWPGPVGIRSGGNGAVMGSVMSLMISLAYTRQRLRRSPHPYGRRSVCPFRGLSRASSYALENPPGLPGPRQVITFAPRPSGSATP